jgi:hypothetical protein
MTRTASLATWLPPEGEVAWRHDLAIALRFVDPFVNVLPPVPPFQRKAVDGRGDRFRVRVERLRWEAQFWPGDGMYRFLVSNASRDVAWQDAVILRNALRADFPLPVTLPVEVTPVEPERARYFVPSPVTVEFPLSITYNTPQEQLTAYLREVEAYPTPLFRAPPGETCVRGVVRDAAGDVLPNVEVAVHEAATAPPNAIYTRTDASGFFAYRLPWLKRPSLVPAEPSLGVTVRRLGDPAFLTVHARPHPIGNESRATFAYGVTTSIAVTAS